MDSVAVFVGLDYHQDSIQVAVMDESGQLLGNRRCANRASAVVAFAEQWGSVRRAAVEACGGSANLAEALRDRAKWHVEPAHPGFVRRMKQNPDKTDYSDAGILVPRWGSHRLLEAPTWASRQATLGWKNGKPRVDRSRGPATRLTRTGLS